jgi:hypothetical protein
MAQPDRPGEAPARSQAAQFPGRSAMAADMTRRDEGYRLLPVPKD